MDCVVLAARLTDVGRLRDDATIRAPYSVAMAEWYWGDVGHVAPGNGRTHAHKPDEHNSLGRADHAALAAATAGH